MIRTLLLSLGLALTLTGSNHAQDVSARDLLNEGIQDFFDAKIKESVAAFDLLIKASQEIKPQLWQRGLSLYYAEKYKEGREQFEVHQTVNPNDVENAAWHFICVARLEGVEAARKALIPIKGDARVPMKEVHDLFAGTGTVDAIMKAAEAGDEGPQKRNQLCYAHLYLGLYFEALGDNDKAKEHILKAAVDYKMDHYMGRCAQVHAKLRGWE
jgi:lipoprotein NlpI